MVKFIPYQLTFGLRSKILRNNLPLEECEFPTDKLAGAFHLAYYLGEDEIATIASFFPKQHAQNPLPGYQLRGMATDAPYVGKGYGRELVKFAIEYIQNTPANYIWCNARTSAVDFYQKMGFSIVSAPFEIAGVGPHCEMLLNLKEQK